MRYEPEARDERDTLRGFPAAAQSVHSIFRNVVSSVAEAEIGGILSPVLARNIRLVFNSKLRVSDVASKKLISRTGA